MADCFLRLDLDVMSHPKISRLITRYGDRGYVSLLRLWIHAAKFNQEDGRFDGMSAKELGAIACAPGKKPEEFIDSLATLGLLDFDGQTFGVHRWAERQPYFATAAERSARNTKNAIDGWARRSRSSASADNSENQASPSSSNSKNAIEDWYDREFLARYPAPRRENQRAGALAELRKLKPTKEKLQQIIASLELWNRSPEWTKEGGEYAPGPGKFLKGKMYERTPAVGGTNGNGARSPDAAELLEQARAGDTQ